MHNYYTKTLLELPYFETINLPTFYEKKKISIQEINGKVTKEVNKICKCCGGTLHLHSKERVKLKHFAGCNVLIKINVSYERYKCYRCNNIVKQEIPFKIKNHFITKLYASQIKNLLIKGNMTNKAIANVMSCNATMVKQIDKDRLKAKYKDLKPTHYSRYIGVDEFSLHKNHVYATVVADLETGEVLYLEKGNKAQQLHNFFDLVGNNFMKRVKSISMDMNASYSKAVLDRYPNIDITYDKFHIIKRYNDTVISETRKEEQNRLIQEIEEAKNNRDKEKLKLLTNEYKLFKNSRFTLLSNRSTLEAKDKAAKEHNRYLYETYEKKGLSIPSNERKYSTNNVKRLENVLRVNSTLQTCYVLNEMLKSGLSVTNQEVFETGIKRWIDIARKTNIEALDKFSNMLERRMYGIVTIAKHNISNGRVEGINNLIKTIRRQAYGYRDQEYFFLKIWDASRRYSHSKSHRKTG